MVHAGAHHALVGTLSNGKDVWWALAPPFAYIDLHGAKSIDGKPLVRVDGNAKEARVGVDQLVDIPHHRVPEDASISQIGEAGHIIRAVKLGRVDLADLLLLEDLHLTANLDRDLVAILGLQQTLQVATISLEGHRRITVSNENFNILTVSHGKKSDNLSGNLK